MKYFSLILLTLTIACGSQPSGVIEIPGPQGSPGPSGSPGVGLISTSVAALPSQCEYGGNTLIIAQDTEGLGVWSPKDLDQTAITTCNGIPGVQGATGPQGNAGTNSTPVSTVQFCKGYQTSYPGTFPEFGLIIGGSIYAVYWDGLNAWLSEIPPGNYASTSTSAPCDFTVNTDGTVSN